MIRVIFWIIISFIAAKIFGAVLRTVRIIFFPGNPLKPKVHRPQQRQSSHVIEDVDYEEITDKKK